MTKQLFSLLALISIYIISAAQTNISGVVNDYQFVFSFKANSNSVVVANAGAYEEGDLVLIIQMQGAIIDESLSNNFGTINDFNGAGKYELQRICHKTGNQLFFENPFKHSYQESGVIQIIRVPEYANGATLNGILTGKAWDGSTGGVFALKCTGALNLGSMSINMTGKGFRGGEALPSGDDCFFVSRTSQFTDRQSADDKALKGEGIATYITGKECSRGPQANGGGGGNNHNGGGSGGANYGIGGAGGQRVKSSSLKCGSVVGLNSISLATEINNGSIFMGGGGGAGHGNNTGSIGEKGENGGGIIFIIADEITGTNRSGIYSNGETGKLNTENEGGGGGGAGGSIILDVTTFTNAINISANGGNGAYVDNIGSGNCSGPGGGGGGGVIAFTNSTIPATTSINTASGLAGEIASSAQPGCNIGDKNGGRDGDVGVTLVNFNIYENTAFSIIKDSVSVCDEYISPSGKYTWTTNGVYMDTVSHAIGCKNVMEINVSIEVIDTTVTVVGYEWIVGAGFPNAWKCTDSTASYQWFYEGRDSSIKLTNDTNQLFDLNKTQNHMGFGYYYAVLTKNGCSIETEKIQYYVESIADHNKSFQIKMSPNPSFGKFNITSTDVKLHQTKVYTLLGGYVKTIEADEVGVIEGELNTKGVYILKVETAKGEQNLRLVIQ